LLDAATHLEEGTETAGELMELVRAGSSLGGARPKAHVIHATGHLSIAKFPRVQRDSWDVCAWEKVALELAAAAGVIVPVSQLLQIAGRNVLMVRRFDRRGDERIGYASAMTMVEATDGDTRSYLDIAARIEEVSPFATNDLQQLWRRIAFSILISNTDDHLRNHGFLHQRATSWSLSPAFDLNPNADPGPKRLATTIVPGDATASIELLISVAPLFRLGEQEVASTLSEVLDATSAWGEVAQANGLAHAEIKDMSPAFDHLERQAAIQAAK